MASAAVPTQHMTQVGGGQSTWQPSDWAIEPPPGVCYLEVLKDVEVLDWINLNKRRHIFGRQLPTCDLSWTISLSRANTLLLFLTKMEAHGTFVANERLTKDSPVEIEVGQSLQFAARKNNAALFPSPPKPTLIELPYPPDPSDEEAVLLLTHVNRPLKGLTWPDIVSKSSRPSSSSGGKDDSWLNERAHGVDVETEPGPMGVKEGSLVGNYESLVQITIIPQGKEHTSVKEVCLPNKRDRKTSTSCEQGQDSFKEWWSV
ncbi:nuclear inhibitor of phosphatase 1 [Olea europaea subsp. europaea]|uniref:Nuclear inhibitor of phosphatase 1 n=1 Tax=Olea europaea subsp. europaea TaxID=158383 RepID=A0A8S0QCS9_OLEEU|nr:nuclear inhibitor of phosphatase 1 [Olea europaea subsp. europaea]